MEKRTRYKVVFATDFVTVSIIVTCSSDEDPVKKAKEDLLFDHDIDVAHHAGKWWYHAEELGD